MNIPFALSLPLLPLVLPLPEFAPPQVIYAKDLVQLLFAPWTFPSTQSRTVSRLLQSSLIVRLPKNAVLPCYLLWIGIALTRTLLGFLLSRSIGWTYPHLFSHWALYESSGGCGPPLVTYLIASGVRPDLSTLLSYLRWHRWQVSESLALLVLCALLAGLDNAPWTYGIATVFALLALSLRAVFPALETTHSDSQAHPKKRIRVDFQTAFLLLVFILLPNIIHPFLARHPIPSPFKDGVMLDILLLSYPRPNDDQHAILSQTISSYLPFVSSTTTLSVFTHASPATHPAFSYTQLHFKEAPVTFYVDQDTHPDAYQGQHLHLAEAFRWLADKGTAEWVMLVEDDFPICGEWGWHSVLRVMHALEPGPESTKIWGGFVGTGGSGLIIHRTLLPVLAQTLRLHALIDSPLPAFMVRRPADVIIQACLLGLDPLCPTTPSSKDVAEGIWFPRQQSTMVITSRLVMDHIGGNASTARGRVYDTNKWRCGWRHPFHGRPQVLVVPV